MRAAVEERYAEALRRSRPRRRRRRSPGASSSARASRSAATTARAPRSCAASMSGRGSTDGAGGAGVLDQHAAQLTLGQAVGRGRRRRPRCPCPRHGCGPPRWSAGARRRRRRTGPSRCAVRPAYERHRLRGSGALVEQRRVGGRQPGQVGDDGLEVEQRLEAALGDLRLVRRVGGVPAGVLEHVAPDHRRRDGRVVAEADHRLGRPVLRGEVRSARAVASSSRGSGRSRSPRRGCRRAPRPPSATRATRARSRSSMGRRRRVAGRCAGRRTRRVRRGRVAVIGGSLVGVSRRLPLCRSGEGLQSANPARSGCLRGSGEELPLRRATLRSGSGRAATLPRGIVSDAKPSRVRAWR